MASIKSVVSGIVRVPLRAIPNGTVVPILRGPLRGRKWTTGTLTHQCWLGGYEPERQAEFARLIRKGDVVLDVGANVGFYSLLGAVLAGREGRVIAFEPVGENVAHLRRHLSLNELEDRVEVIEAAVANRPGLRRFTTGEYRATGKLDGGGDIEIPAVSLDDMMDEGRLSRVDFIKIDVEGAELEVLEGAMEMLKRFRPRLVVELHNPEMDRRCPELLRKLGYRIEPMDLWEDGVTVRGGFTALPGGSEQSFPPIPS